MPRDPAVAYRALAAAVLRCALQDAQAWRPHLRHRARRWLLAEVNPDRAFWATAAGLDDARVRDGARRALGGT